MNRDKETRCSKCCNTFIDTFGANHGLQVDDVRVKRFEWNDFAYIRKQSPVMCLASIGEILEKESSFNSASFSPIDRFRVKRDMARRNLTPPNYVSLMLRKGIEIDLTRWVIADVQESCEGCGRILTIQSGHPRQFDFGQLVVREASWNGDDIVLFSNCLSGGWICTERFRDLTLKYQWTGVSFSEVLQE